MKFPWYALGVLVFLLAAPVAQAQTLVLQEAEFALGSMTEPPGVNASWTPQRLPDHWRDSRPQADGMGWYQMHFQREALGPGLLAVYLPQASVNAEVYLNGRLLGSGGSLVEPIARTWNHPRLYLVAPELLQPGRNTLQIRLRAHLYTQASLSAPHIGPDRELRPVYEQAYFLRVTLNQMASIMIAAVSALMLSLWWRRRHDTAYGYFAISAMVWSLQSTNLYLRDVPLPTAQWEILVNASFQLFSALLLISMLRFVKADWRPLNVWLLASMLLSPLAMLLAPAEYFLMVTSVVHMLTLVGAVGALLLLLRAAWTQRSADARMLLLALMLIVLFAGHDWLLHGKHLWIAGDLSLLPVNLYLLQYSAPVLFFAIGWIMTVRFIQALNAFEVLSVELEQRVNEKHAQLEMSFSYQRELERERAVQDERERIHSDLHDDVGAKLLTLVYRAGSVEVADLARSALQDLRDVVSRSGSEAFEMEAVLADWHAECEQRLSCAHIGLVWLQPADPAVVILTQPQVLNVGRIVREAITNILRHAHAHGVTASFVCQEDRLDIEIRDDGVGGHEEPRRLGRGTRNMQSRAALMGARFERVWLEPHGCAIRLWVPIAAK